MMPAPNDACFVSLCISPLPSLPYFLIRPCLLIRG
jgi:hypothetical protein